MTAVAFTGGENFVSRLVYSLFRPILFVFRLLFRRKKAEPLRKFITPSKSTSDTLDVADEHDPNSELWSEARLEVCERLWGEGCLTPFTAEFVISALRLIEVDESKSLLQLGSALGGTARAVVNEIGVWISGYEEDEEIVEIAKLRSKMAGMSKKAAISKYEPAKPKFKQNSYNVALAYECLTHIEDKEELFKAIHKSLRSNGHFIMTDYVLPNSEPPNEAVTRWFKQESMNPKLWTSRRIYDTLNELSFDVRVAEDYTKTYRNLVFTGWLNLLSQLTKKELTPDFATALIKECEYWIYRISALDSGGLKVYRYHAIKED